MSFYGSIVLSRSDTLLPRLPETRHLGYRFSGLRELGGGWQIVQMGSVNDPPDMVSAVARISQAWDQPILAAYVADACFQLHTCAPGGKPTSAHLPGPELTENCGMLHRPEPTAGLTHAQVQEQLEDWARQAGLTASGRRLKRVISYRYERSKVYLSCHEQVYELVHALGFDEFPAEVPPLLDPESEPFRLVSGHLGGIAVEAWFLAARRRLEPGKTKPAAPWEEAAIRFQEDVYRARYDATASLAELTLRYLEVLRLHREATGGGILLSVEPAQMVQEVLRLREEGQLVTPEFWPDRLAGRGYWPGR